MPPQIPSCLWALFMVMAIALSSCKSLPSPQFRPENPITSQCMIMDSSGELLWSYPSWLCVFLPDGRFISGDESGIRMHGADLKIEWEHKFVPHHMISLAANGDILTLTSNHRPAAKYLSGFEHLVEVDWTKETYRLKTVPPSYAKETIRSDKIIRLSPSGKILAEKKLIDDPSYPRRWLIEDWSKAPSPDQKRPLEVSHVNSIYEIGVNASPREEFATGNIVVNDTVNRLIFILDPSLQKIRWRLNYKELGFQTVHDVQVLPNGHLLMFKNLGKDLSLDSSIAEVDPVERKIVWEYFKPSKGAFRAGRMGSVQALDHDRFFFAHTTAGRSRAEIVGRDKKTQWTLDLNPHTDVDMQGAYSLPVRDFLGATRRRQVFRDYPELRFAPFAAKSDSLHVRKYPPMTETEARAEIKLQNATLRRFLSKQIDPYVGASAKSSDCDLPGVEQAQIKESASQLSLDFLLISSPHLAVDCYGNGPNRQWDRRSFLFCKKSGALFEIDYFRPLKEAKPMEAPALCAH